nr:MAG TPA: hypothetical protein [Caudoviricetes sp.]
MSPITLLLLAIYTTLLPTTCQARMFPIRYTILFSNQPVSFNVFIFD